MMKLPIFLFTGFVITSACLALHLTGAPSPRPFITAEEVKKSLAENEAQWREKIRTTHPRLLVSNEQWPQVSAAINNVATGPRAAVYARFLANVDAQLKYRPPAYRTPEQVAGTRGDAKTLYSAQEELWQREIGDKIFSLAVAARMFPEKKYREKMRDIVLATLDYDTWGKGQPPKMGPNTDLAAGHIARSLGLAWDWHRDAFSAGEQAKIIKTISARLPNLLEALYGSAFWARSYEDNHNHVSVAALAYCGIAFYDDIPDAPSWLAAARLNFQQVGNYFPSDGSSAEGLSYWAYGMSYILQYIEGTRHIIDSGNLYQKDFLKNAANYRFHSSTSGLKGNLLWGDAVPRDWSSSRFIIYRLASEYNDADAAWFADNLPVLRNRDDETSLSLLWASTAPAAAANGPQVLDYHHIVSDIVNTRSGWSDQDYLLSIKSGFTNRNHSHLDAGALAIAYGDEWILRPPGYGKGGGERDFWGSSGPRWDYFSNATQSHATLLINDRNQRFDRDARGVITRFFSAPAGSFTSIDLKQAYHDVSAITRDVLHRRGDYILVMDTVATPAPAVVEWLGQFRSDPVKQPDGVLVSQGTAGGLRAKMLRPANVEFELRAPTLSKVDVDPKTHFTWTARQSNVRDAEFLVLLQPFTSASRTAPLQTRIEGDLLQITGQGWTDHIAWTAESASRASTFAGKIDCSVMAHFASLRTDSTGGIQAFWVIDATVVQFPGFSFRSEIPCDLAAQKNTDGTWHVTSNRDITQAISIPPGQVVHVGPLSSPK